MLDWPRSDVLVDSDAKALQHNETDIELRAATGTGKLKLKCRPKFADELGAIEKLLGCPLPQTAQTLDNSEPRIFWQTPSEWLIIIAATELLSWQKKLRQSECRHTWTIDDVSDALVCIEIAGPASPVLLAEACGIDLHPQHFATGRYTGTSLFGLSVLLHRVSNEPRFHLYIDSSLAWHLWQWLAKGMQQFAAPTHDYT